MKHSIGTLLAILVVFAGALALADRYYPHLLPGYEEDSRWLNGTVVRVIDGDSFRLQVGAQIFGVEMIGIDAPENGQKYGDHAGDYLAELVENRSVMVEAHGNNGHGDLLGELFLDGVSINKLLLTDGFVWAKRGLLEDSAWVGLEQLARTQRFGLWRYDNIIPPWEFRELPLDFEG